MTNIIIIDRDGVINFDSPAYIKSPEEWLPIPGSLEAIAQLNRHNYQVVIATNQSGVARGYYDLETLDRIHEKLIAELAAVGGFVTEIFFCPHHPDENCFCRKPKPGLLHRIQEKFSVDLKNTFFIGDSWTDMQVAFAMGCKPILVLTGNGNKTLTEHPELANIQCFADLAKASDYIIEQR